MTRTSTTTALFVFLLVANGCDRMERDPPLSAGPEVAANGTVSSTPVSEPQGAVVIVSVTGVESGGEPIDAALQTELQWGEEEATYRARVPADADAVALRFEGVTPGRYGVVAVQPTLPATKPRSPSATLGNEEPASTSDPKADARTKPRAPASLAVRTAGGWAATGATGRKLPDWDKAARSIGSDGDTVPVTLTRR